MLPNKKKSKHYGPSDACKFMFMSNFGIGIFLVCVNLFGRKPWTLVLVSQGLHESF